MLVGEWVVTGCVVLRSLLGSLSLLSDLAWWAGWYRSVGVDWWVSGLLGASFYHHHHHPPPTFPCYLVVDMRQRTKTLLGGRTPLGWSKCMWTIRYGETSSLRFTCSIGTKRVRMSFFSYLVPGRKQGTKSTRIVVVDVIVVVLTLTYMVRVCSS